MVNFVKIRKGFVNGLPANIKISKTQLTKIIQSRGFIFGSPNMIGPGIISDIFTKELYSLLKSISKNLDVKKLNEDDLVNAGLNIIGKRIKKEFHQLRAQG